MPEIVLNTQQTIAHFRITAKLGEGGMGEVWRATDTKLNRDVAIKILPEPFASDSNRLARFTRESQVLASLNHPNIAAIYGIEERALVLELVEGPTLADRLAQGPLPLDEALKVALQITEALEYAHERGIVHRDLKPANVKLTPEGRVKVLDFGLAKLLSSEPVTGNSMSSPTLTISATTAGMLLGTPAYMSPEQAKGGPADRRADIWAFGVLMYELLAGSPLYSGETASEVLASVMMLEPDFGNLPETTPAAIRKLLKRCVTKDARRRLQAIGEARVTIEDVLSGVASEPQAPITESSVLAHALPWGLAAIFASALCLVSWVWMHPAPEPSQPVIRYTIVLPGISRVTGLAISKDGSRFAYSDNNRQIYVRQMDQLEAKPLAGTQASGKFFFSSDGSWILFNHGERLHKIPVGGGSAVPLREIEVPGPNGLALLSDGTLIFTRDGALMQAPLDGGKAKLIVAPDAKQRRTTAYSPLRGLPDARGVLFSTQQGSEDEPVSVFMANS